MTTQAPPSNEELLAERDKQIERRESAESPGVKAAATTKIRVIEAMLKQNGFEDFETYQLPSGSTVSVTNLGELSNEDLQSAHTEAVELRNTAESAGVKAATTQRIKRLEEEMTKRELEFTPYAPQQPASESLTNDQLVDQYNQLTAEREQAISPGIKAALTRRITANLQECAKRDIDPKPAEEPEGENAGDAGDGEGDSPTTGQLTGENPQPAQGRGGRNRR